jgi:hypothetical protein
MHESGVAARAVDAVAAAAPAGWAGRPPSSLEAVITDPAHLDVDAVTMHLEIALAERGWPGVPVAVTVEPVVCSHCGATNRPEGEWPFCATCGAALPEPPGPGIEVSATW